MFIKQISVFVENKSGRLAEITAILAKANIDIRALSVADTIPFRHSTSDRPTVRMRRRKPCAIPA